MTQKWYADDGSVVGKLEDIKALFDKLTEFGPKYGYLVNPPKCQLIIKPGGKRQASTVFAGTNVEITQGARVLGSVIGSSEASKNFLKDAETKYTKSLDRLGQFALISENNIFSENNHSENNIFQAMKASICFLQPFFDNSRLQIRAQYYYQVFFNLLITNFQVTFKIDFIVSRKVQPNCFVTIFNHSFSYVPIVQPLQIITKLERTKLSIV